MTSLSLSSTIGSNSGAHLTSTTTISVPQPAAYRSCSLHLHFTLPPSIFVDQYELANYQAQYMFKHWGTSNLELPVSAVSAEGSALLLNVTQPTEGSTSVNVAVPMHARYDIVAESSAVLYREALLHQPKGFFACSSSSSSPRGVASFVPDLRTEFMAYFDLAVTKFVEIPPARGAAAHDTIRLPVGNLSHLFTVELGTALCIIGLFFYLSHVSYTTWRRLQSNPRQKTE
ncbi:hypothetical protein HGRIS_000822 [Hohenbuehelia grisea]|uniref:Protein PBN1 n=1 Tax=Hohenbuehelia grisea TaxID=104357 RepID=A0ABR3IPU8_9AGAR